MDDSEMNENCHGNKKIVRRRALSLVEIMLAIIIFVLGFIPLIRLFSESGISQQRLVRDYPVVVSIVERILATIENEIEEGRFDYSMVNGIGSEWVDITSAVIENQEVNQTLKMFYGQDNKAATRFISRCLVKLKAQPYSDPNLIKIGISFSWDDKSFKDGKFRHNIEFFLLKKKNI